MWRPRKVFNRHAFKPNPRERCVLMTNKVAAFGASQLGRVKSALSTHKGGGFALSREPNRDDVASSELYLVNVG